MSEDATCGEKWPGGAPLGCLKPPDHDGEHATCLGYHPEPYDEWEWVEWDGAA